MSDATERPLVRDASEIEAEPVDAAEGLSKAVLVGEERGAGNLAIRKFTLAPGAEVPRHTNAVEHEQYVLSGEYVVGIESEASETSGDGAAGTGAEHTVGAGDALHVPAGAVHWYRNESEEPGAFLCAVPTGDDSIELVED